MLDRRFYGKKNAGVTVEVTLSIVLTVTVLFLVLGLFGNNLSIFDANNGNVKDGMKNLFKPKPANSWADTTAKRTQISVVDPTQSQENVELVGAQGLDWYLSQAQGTYNKYYPRTDLTQTEAQDLARAALKLKIGDASNGSRLTLDQRKYLKTVGITLPMTLGTTFEVNVNGKSLSVPYNSANVTNDETCLKAIKDVESKSFG